GPDDQQNEDCVPHALGASNGQCLKRSPDAKRAMPAATNIPKAPACCAVHRIWINKYTSITTGKTDNNQCITSTGICTKTLLAKGMRESVKCLYVSTQIRTGLIHINRLSVAVPEN